MPGDVPGFQCDRALDAAPPVQLRRQIAHAAGADQFTLDCAAQRAGARQQVPQAGMKPLAQ